MPKPSILSYDGSWLFAGVHAVTWVGAAIFGLLVYLNVNDATGASDDTKLMCLVSFILPIVIAVVAVAVSGVLGSDWTPDTWVMAIALGFVNLSLVFSAAVLYTSLMVADTYLLAVCASLFTSLGAGMANLFHTEATLGSGKVASAIA